MTRSAALGTTGLARMPAPAARESGGVSTPFDDPDRDLALRAAEGQRAAFEILIRRHYDRMHRIAWRMTGSRDEADDVVQDVCCGLVDRIGSFKGHARFTTWLFGVVVNACRDHGRRTRGLARLKAGWSVVAGLVRPEDGRDLHRRRWIASELGRLDRSLRETVVLVAGEGLTHAEAGAALGVAEATVSWRMHEARRQLGERLGRGEVR